MRVIQALGNTGLATGIELISPSLRMVLVVLRVEPAENPVLEFERLIHQEKSVGVGDDTPFTERLALRRPSAAGRLALQSNLRATREIPR